VQRGGDPQGKGGDRKCEEGREGDVAKIAIYLVIFAASYDF